MPCELNPVTNAPCDGLFTSALEILAHNNITGKSFSDYDITKMVKTKLFGQIYIFPSFGITFLARISKYNDYVIEPAFSLFCGNNL